MPILLNALAGASIHTSSGAFAILTDTTPPTVTITAPITGTQVMGTVSLVASAADDVGIAGVQFYANGIAVGAEEHIYPYSTKWDTSTLVPGSYSITARARDAAGNAATSAAVTVKVVADTIAPTVAVTSPVSAAVVTGDVTLVANAADNGGIAGVQFYANGIAVGAEEHLSPYSTNWDTTKVVPGAYSITARARDEAGNQTTSAAVSVTVKDTTPPTIAVTSPISGAVTTSTMTLSASASDVGGVAGVQFYANGTAVGTEDLVSPYSAAWDTTKVAPGLYSITARARDAAGNQATSAAVTVTVPDITAPTISVTAPSAGTSLMGAVALAANAADNVGVAGVQFYANGVAVGAEGHSAPYSTSWDTSKVTPGSYSITARARDAAGNQTTSAAVAVQVVADTIRPVVTLTSPSIGAVLAGTVSLTASASDNVGVVGVQFFANTTAIGNEVTVPPYSVPWATTGVANGTGYVITARARDLAGNQTTSAGVSISISNVTAALTLQHSVALSWVRSPSTVMGYHVYRSSQTGGPYTRLTTTVDPLTVYTDSTVSSGCVYYYIVTAVAANNVESIQSNESVASIPQ